MIGQLKITAKLQPRIGDRDDYLVRAIGPGDTDYTFLLSMTRTVLSIWGVKNSEETCRYLAEGVLKMIGTASVPPTDGFWFDSYNSGDTPKHTIDKVWNLGISSFTKGNLGNAHIKLLGKDLFNQKDIMDDFFVDKYGFEFFRSFEDAFEDSQVIDDLNATVNDNAHLLYRICILSVFIDHINVRLTGEKSAVLSLQAFKNWVSRQKGTDVATKLTKTFQMVKNLRKQYPIHEHFEVSAAGIRQERKEIVEAKLYFGLSSDIAKSWSNVFQTFSKSLDDIRQELS